MRIQVDCRDGDDARAFYLGTRRLHVRVLERIAEDATRRFKVRIDGAFPQAEPALASRRIRSR